jgi:hypothetical protein
LLGRFAKQGTHKGQGSGAYYQIELTRPCERCQRKVETAPGDPREYEDYCAQVGETVSIDERTAMEGLAKFLDDPEKKWEVYIKFVEKQKISGTNRTFWDVDVRAMPAVIPF